MVQDRTGIKSDLYLWFMGASVLADATRAPPLAHLRHAPSPSSPPHDRHLDIVPIRFGGICFDCLEKLSSPFAIIPRSVKPT